MIELGGRARDSVTGFTGVVTTVAQHLNEPPTAILTSEKLSRDGQPCRSAFALTRLVAATAKSRGKGPANRNTTKATRAGGAKSGRTMTAPADMPATRRAAAA